LWCPLFQLASNNISVAGGAIQEALHLLLSRSAASAVRKAVIFFSFDLIYRRVKPRNQIEPWPGVQGGASHLP